MNIFSKHQIFYVIRNKQLIYQREIMKTKSLVICKWNDEWERSLKFLTRIPRGLASHL